MKLVTRRGQPHEYLEQERSIDLFSSSQVRKVAHDTYAGIPLEVLEQARARGTMLHRRFWKVLAHSADLMAMPLPIPGLEGYCLSMDAWVERNKVTPMLLEQPSAALKFGYAGTPDALVRYGQKQIPALIDLKTGMPTKTDPMQLICYQKMEGYEEAKLLIDVYAQADGKIAKEGLITKGMQATEWAWFMSALGVLQSRVNHGCR